MNYPQGNNSSGSDEEDQTGALSQVRSTGRQELHNDKHCKYERCHYTLNGRTVYMHIRICQCGMYTDRKEILNQALSLHEIDGKKVHFCKECKWKRKTIVIGGRRVHALNEYCAGCIQPQTNTPVSAMNSKYATLNSLTCLLQTFMFIYRYVYFTYKTYLLHI